MFTKMHQFAVTSAKYNPKGAKAGVDYERVDNSDESDGGWSDDSDDD